MAKLFAIAAAAIILGVEAKTIDITWKDCGTSATHAHVLKLTTDPDPPVLGQLTKMTGSGTLDEQLTSGQYEVKVKVGPFTAVDHKDNVCGDTHFDMTVLGVKVGSIVVHGPKCPLAAGNLTLGIDMTLTDKVPAGVGSATVTMSGTDQNSAPLVCMTLDAKIVGAEEEEADQLCCKCVKGTDEGADKVLFAVTGSSPTACNKCCSDVQYQGMKPYHEGEELKGQCDASMTPQPCSLSESIEAIVV